METPQFDINEQASSGLELSIFEILALLRRNIKLILILTILFGAASYGYSKLMIKPTYASSATVFIQPKVSANQVSYNDLLTNQKLIDTYTQIAKSNLVVNEVYPSFLRNKLTKADIVGAISVASIKDTEIIKFSVISTDPNLSAAITNKVVAVFITKVNSIMELDNLKIIDTATSNMTPVGPASLRNGIIGALIGLMLSVGIIFLRFLLNNTFKSAQDVEHYLGLPVLGEIHFYE